MSSVDDPLDVANEETLRSQVLVPWLGRLGLRADEVRIEERFKLRLGRQIHEVGGWAGGRADLVVRDAHGSNLFVVEAKAPGHALTDDDRDQGISYARLLHPIAPFVLLTNGSESQIFDSITKRELKEEQFPGESDFYRAGGRLATAEDVRLRWEALRHFVGYSTENLQAFSRAQVGRSIQPLLGLDGKAGKYARNLFVSRSEPREAVERFLHGQSGVFVIVGESGVGKTSFMCALAEELAGSHVTLFLSAQGMATGPTEAVLDEFNWDFPEQLEAPQLFWRLGTLAEATKSPVVILIDGVDEAVFPNAPQQMNEFARRISEIGGGVRLVVSAKTAQWPRFSHIRGTPSALLLAMDTDWQRETSASEGPRERRPFVLGDFTTDELELALTKYQRAFSLYEAPVGRLREHCRNPFFLRVVSEAYEGKQKPLPEAISGDEVAKHWLDRKLEGLSDPDGARRDLRAVAAAVWERAKCGMQEQETLGSLETVEEAALEAPIQDELVAFNVLLRTEDNLGRRRLSFYYGRIRDFMIARHVLELDRLGAEEFQSLLPDLLANHVGEQVLAWHLGDAPVAHMKLVKDVIRGRASLFLQEYVRIFDHVAPGFRAGVEPYTTGAIGLAYEVGPYGLESYGLFPAPEDAVTRLRELRPKHDGRRWPFAADLAALGGSARAGGHNFVNSDPEEAAVQFAFERIKEALQQGALDEKHSTVLVSESVLAIASYHRKKLGLPERTSWALPTASLLPLDLALLGRRAQAYFGAEHYRNAWSREQVTKQTRFVTARGGGMVSIQYDPDAISSARERAREEAEAGAEFPAPRIVGQEDLSQLPSLIRVLQAKGVARIQTPPLPHLETSSSSRDPFIDSTDEQLRALLMAFFEKGLAAYKALVEHNLSGILDHLRLFRNLPCRAVVSFRRPQPSDAYPSWGHVQWCLVGAASISAEVHIDREGGVIQRAGGVPGAAWVTYDGRPLLSGFSGTGLQRLIAPYDVPGFGGSAANSAREAPIRAFAYDLVERDLKELDENVLREAP